MQSIQQWRQKQSYISTPNIDMDMNWYGSTLYILYTARLANHCITLFLFQVNHTVPDNNSSFRIFMIIAIIGYPNFTYNWNINSPYIFFWEPFIMDISEQHTILHNDRLLLCYHEACLAGTRPLDRKWMCLYIQDDDGSRFLFNMNSSHTFHWTQNERR